MQTKCNFAELTTASFLIWLLEKENGHIEEKAGRGAQKRGLCKS